MSDSPFSTESIKAQLERLEESEGNSAVVSVDREAVEAEVTTKIGTWGRASAWAKRMWNGEWAAGGKFKASWFKSS